MLKPKDYLGIISFENFQSLEEKVFSVYVFAHVVTSVGFLNQKASEKLVNEWYKLYPKTSFDKKHL